MTGMPANIPQVPMSNQTAQAQGQNFDFLGMISGILTGFATGAGQGVTGGQPQVIQQPPQKDNTAVFLIGGVLLVVLIAAIFFIRKK